MNTELLRETLRHHAGDAPPSTSLLDAVRDRSRRRHRRRVTTASVAVAAAVALVATGTTIVVRGTATEPAPARPAGSDTLVPPSYELPPFPFTPGWLPEGYGEPYYGLKPGTFSQGEPADTLGAYLELRHLPSSGSGSYFSAGPYLAVAVHSGDPGREFVPIDDDFAQQATTVRGRDAVLYTGRTDESAPDEVADNRVAVVSWLDRPDRWVTVSGVNGFGAAEVIRYAEELVEQPVPGQAPFTFDLLPPDLKLRSVSPNSMSFEPVGGSRHYDAGIEGVRFARDVVSVSVHTAGSASYVGCVDPETGEILTIINDLDECVEPTRESIQVDGRTAELIGGETLRVPFDGERELWVTAKGALALGQEDLIRLTAGIHLTPYARPGESG